MISKTGVGAFCAVLLAASPSFAAVSVANQDTHPHTVVINQDKGESQQNIEPGKTVQVNCHDTCGFRDLAFGYSRLAGGSDKLVIDHDGELHFAGGHGDVEMPGGSN